LLTYVKPHAKLLMLAIVSMVVYAASSTGFAALMQPMLDGSFVERDSESILFVPIMIVFVFMCRGIAGFVSTYLMASIGWSVVTRIRRQLFDKYLELPTSSFDTTSTGDLISRVTFNVSDGVSQLEVVSGFSDSRAGGGYHYLSRQRPFSSHKSRYTGVDGGCRECDRGGG